MHPECVEEKARALMSRVGPTLGMHGGVLAGATGLALHLGHRISGELEFFAQRAFKPSEVLEELRALAGVVESVTMGDDAMIVQADGARLSLMQTSAHFGEPTTRLNGCDVASVVDIAAMKLLAVSQGGTRSDFVDLYTVLQTVPFRKVARNALERYGVTVLDPLGVGKGLVWFEHADVQEDPVYVGTPVTWDHIRDFSGRVCGSLCSTSTQSGRRWNRVSSLSGSAAQSRRRSGPCPSCHAVRVWMGNCRLTSAASSVPVQRRPTARMGGTVSGPSR